MAARRPRRALYWGVFFIPFVTIQAASAAPCMTAAEKHAFEMRAMQSQLMIVTLHCNDGGYNAFAQQHRDDLVAGYAQIGRYFARINGTSGEAERDDYITQLANALEVAGMRRQNYCIAMHDFVIASLATQTDQDMEQVLVRNGTNVNRFQVCAESDPAARLDLLLRRIESRR